MTTNDPEQMSHFQQSVTSASSTWPCAVCAAPISGRSHRRTCSPRCRQALARAAHLAREDEEREDLARQKAAAEAKRAGPILAEVRAALADKRIKGRARTALQSFCDYMGAESS